MEYSKKTQKLLDRMNKAAMRQEYVFDKDKITKLVGKSYKLFNLEVPKIEWCVDITDEKFLEAVRAAGTARSTRVARAARAMWEARAAWEDYRTYDEDRITRTARAARAMWEARTARGAGVAWVTWGAGAAGAAWAANDYDDQKFIFTYEFLQTHKGNKSNYKFVEAQELFLQLKEVGCGYLAEQDGIIYVCPNPIISIDENFRYHSLTKPAIYWQNGLKLFHLNGINFEEKLWNKIVNKSMAPIEILKMENQEQKAVAIKLYGWDNLLSELKAEILDTKMINMSGDDLFHQVLEIKQDGWIGRFLRYTDPSDNKQGILRVDHNIDETKTVDGAREYGFKRIKERLGVNKLEFIRET